MYREVRRREDVSAAHSPLGGDTMHTSNGRNMHNQETLYIDSKFTYFGGNFFPKNPLQSQ